MLIENNTKFKACPLCGSKKILRIGELPKAKKSLFSSYRVSLIFSSEIWKCCTCKSGFKQNIVDAKTAINLYSQGFSDARWSSKTFEEVKTPEVLELVSRVSQHASNILDVGCNTGELLDFLKKDGCITHGVEPSETSRSLLTSKGHIAYASINECKEVYDVIYAFDLVEHLHDLPGFLFWARDKLVSNGRLVILTGNINSISARLSGSSWWYSSYPEHIVFPSKSYFRNHSGYRSEAFVCSYASKGYRQPFHRIVLSIIKLLLKRRKYIGLPSCGPDHMLIVLVKQFD